MVAVTADAHSDPFHVGVVIGGPWCPSAPLSRVDELLRCVRRVELGQGDTALIQLIEVPTLYSHLRDSGVFNTLAV